MKNTQLFEGERLDEVNEQITLIQKKDGLTFGTDAFLLASYIKPMPSCKAIELGTGTGIISLLLTARNKFAEIKALEIQEDFATLAMRNSSLNGMDNKIEIICTDATKINSRDIGGEVDVVFTNPPYMKVECGKRNCSDYKYIARHEVCGSIDDFCRSAFRLLKHGGLFYAVWRPDRLTDLMYAMRNSRLEPKTMTFVHSDRNSEPSMVLVCAKKGGASGVRISSPLFLHDGENHAQLSEAAQKIYDTMSFDT